MKWKKYTIETTTAAEDFLAGMFGFKMFKPIRDVSTVKGEFGYWCMNICP